MNSFKEGQKFILRKCEEDGVLPEKVFKIKNRHGCELYFYVYQDSDDYFDFPTLDFAMLKDVEKGDLVLCEVKDEK